MTYAAPIARQETKRLNAMIYCQGLRKQLSFALGKPNRSTDKQLSFALGKPNRSTDKQLSFALGKPNRSTDKSYFCEESSIEL
jgi:hypothetical protein